MASLSERVIAWQSGEPDWAAAEQAVTTLVYQFARGRDGLTEEDSAEFLLFFYPRIRRLMERYQPVGSTFEAYLRTTLRWQIRSFVRRRSNDKIRLLTAERTGVTEQAHGDSVELYRSQMEATGPRDVREPASSPPLSARTVENRPCTVEVVPRVDPRSGGLTRGEAQRVLLLALKGCDLMDREACIELADQLGLDPDWLLDVWIYLRSCCEEPRRRREAARATRDAAWFQLRYTEAVAARTVAVEEKERLERKMRYWKRTYRNASERLKHIHVTPTHKDIAEALGVPKGTVDSSIFTARQELRSNQHLQRLARLFDRT